MYNYIYIYIYIVFIYRSHGIGSRAARRALAFPQLAHIKKQTNNNYC